MDSHDLKFLVAEDEFIVALGLKQLLEDMGFKVTSLVSTALEAITKSEADKPDFILMDVQLSGSLNGIEAAEIIRYKHNLPIIFLTDRTNEQILNQSKFASRYHSIRKPVDILQLSELIRQINNETIIQPGANISQPSSYTF
ncbi:MAG: response regulator [Ignavibacteriaceae bacterium]|nr:response regulator [Ignavibacteriaceae bacterium]